MDRHDPGAVRHAARPNAIGIGVDRVRRRLLDFGRVVVVPVAQWIERLPSKQRVAGSNPVRDAIPTYQIGLRDRISYLSDALCCLVASVAVWYYPAHTVVRKGRTWR